MRGPQVGVRLRYHRVAIALHWVVGLLLIGQFAFGFWMENVPRNTPARGFWINQHKSVGLVIGVLILVRIVWRVRHTPPPPLPMAAWQRLAASANHIGLYVCMVLMPLSGYLASNVSKHGVKLFNLVALPPWLPESKVAYAILNQTHKVTAVVLATLVVVHVLAVLKHQLIDRDGLLARMGIGRSVG